MALTHKHDRVRRSVGTLSQNFEESFTHQLCFCVRVRWSKEGRKVGPGKVHLETIYYGNEDDQVIRGFV